MMLLAIMPLAITRRRDLSPPMPHILGRTRMPRKGGDYGSKAVNALAGAAAAFVMRKAIGFAWTKATGRKPPEKAEDPQVALGEAVVWAVLLGAGVAAARVLAIRLATRQSQRHLTGSAASPEE